MPKHPSHDWNENGRCNACDAHVLAFEANYRCIPVKDKIGYGEQGDDTGEGIFGAWLCEAKDAGSINRDIRGA